MKDTRGNVVRNAIVFIRSTPKVTSGGDNAPTATDGWVQYALPPEKDFTIKNSYSVQFYVKAYRANDPTLGGIYGSRLVQVATRRSRSGGQRAGSAIGSRPSRQARRSAGGYW